MYMYNNQQRKSTNILGLKYNLNYLIGDREIVQWLRAEDILPENMV